MTQSTAMVVAQPVTTQIATRALEPNDIGSAYDLAKILAAGRLLPRSLQNPEAAFTVIMAGRELGLTAMQSLRSIYFFDGKLTMSADLMVSLVKRSPVCKSLELIEHTDERVTYETHRVGEEKPTRMSWTIEDAKRAGLMGKDNWKKHPRQMLRARCAAEICRAVYPDVMLGVYDTDELASTDPQRIPTVQVEEIVEHVEASVAATDDRAATYQEKLAACATMAEVDELAVTAKKEGFQGETRKRVGEMFATRRAELQPPTQRPANAA